MPNRPESVQASLHAARRVVFVGSTYAPIVGGAEAYVQRSAHALAQAGAHVAVAVRFTQRRPEGGMAGLLGRYEPPRSYREGPAGPGGVDVRVLAPTRWRAALLRPVYRLQFYAATQPLAARLMEAAYEPALTRAFDGANAVHYSGTGRELLGFAALRYARRTGASFVVTPHLHVGAWGDGALDLRLYRRADAVVAATGVEHAFLTDHGVEAERVHRLDHGVSVDGSGDGARFRARHGLGEAPVVLYLARKAPYKGYDLLREAAPRVWTRVPDARFVFAGPSEPGTPVPTPLDPRALDLGALTNAEREDAYAACTAFCMPSAAEAFGLAYFEAWRYARPVVALRIPTLEELIGEAGGGELAEPTAASLADALVRVLEDPARARALGAAGAHRASGATWTAVADRLLRIYDAPASALAEEAGPEAVPSPVYA